MRPAHHKYGSDHTDDMLTFNRTPSSPQPLSSARPTQPAAPPTIAPVEFPGYELLDEIGRGGMGVVYRARQTKLNRLVALKVILGGPLASSEDQARFRHEAEAAARLKHQNVVQVYDVGEHAGFLYMALELVEGDTLRKWQNGAPTDPRTAAQLMATVARAVQHAHDQGIVHRDIKPANILIADCGLRIADYKTGEVSSFQSAIRNPQSAILPKVTDFGLAKSLLGGADLTVTGAACGTPNYMSPEQVKGKPPAPAIDVYALGAVLYELLTGRPPFVGTDAGEVMSRIVRVEPAGVRGIVPSVPRDLAVIAARCLEKEPGRRYATAGEVADDLERFLVGVPIVARPVGPIPRACRWARRNPILAVFLALMTTAALVTAGLAIALERTVGRERTARGEAEVERRAAEKARDDLREALAVAEERKRAAATAKEAADVDAALALAGQREAEIARTRAEENLRVSGTLIRDSLRTLMAHPRFWEPDFREFRTKMAGQVRLYRDRAAAQSLDTAEALGNLSDVSYFLGSLELNNGNHVAAAEDFKRAADAVERAWLLDTTKPELASRCAVSLVRAGDALSTAKRYRDAEARYRESGAVIAAALAVTPRITYLCHQAYDMEERLANLYRAEGRPVEQYAAAVRAIPAARILVEVIPVLDVFNMLAASHSEAARAADAAGYPDKADGHHADAVAARKKVAEGWIPVPATVLAHTAALVEHAEFLSARDRRDRAAGAFKQALAILERERTGPNTDLYSAEFAIATARYAEFLRAKESAEAERECNRAVDVTVEVMRRNPVFEPARRAWADAVAVRARLYDQTGRYKQAATEWALLAREDINVVARSPHELNVIHSHLSAKDWRAATTAAEALAKKPLSPPILYDLARVWGLIAQQADEPTREFARRHAVGCLEVCLGKGEFANGERVKAFKADSAFDAVRDLFDPAKK